MLVGLALTGALWRLHSREVVLPAPAGPYPVGRVEYDWVDPNRIDPLSETPGQPRKLNAWIWYPSKAPAPEVTPAPYLPPEWVAARERSLGVGTLFTQDFDHVHGHSTEGVPLAAAQTTYPVLIMQPGLGPALPDYTTLCENLASYGYIVAGSTPTGSASVVAFKDGSVVRGTSRGNVPDNASVGEAKRILGDLIRIWVQDDALVLDRLEGLNASDPAGRFTGRINLDAVGVLGHSFGGASAAQFCSQDARCKAGADLDGYPYGEVVQTGLDQPFLFLWSEPVDGNDAAWLQAEQDIDTIFQGLPPGSLQVTIQGTRHFNFTDYAVEYQPVVHVLGGLGPIDGAYALEITGSYLRAFFDETLLGQHDPLLETADSPYPEVQIIHR